MQRDSRSLNHDLYLGYEKELLIFRTYTFQIPSGRSYKPVVGSRILVKEGGEKLIVSHTFFNSLIIMEQKKRR